MTRSSRLTAPTPDEVHAALHRLGIATDDSLRATPLAGVTNRSWRIDLHGEAYALRLPARADAAALPRELELLHHRIACELDLAPALVAADPFDGLMLSRWIADARPVDPFEPRAVERTGQLLARLHRSTARFGWRFRGPEVAARQLGLIPRNDPSAGLIATLAASQAALVEALDGSTLEPRAAHNDPHLGNVLDDGSRLWLIDWEYSGLNDPFWDLAAFAEEAGLDADGERRLLAAWGDPDAAAHRRLRDQRRACRWIAGLWYIGQAALRGDAALRAAGQQRLVSLVDAA
jgi:Ser/Thr protein kinase RdoA (MazF antagonist)